MRTRITGALYACLCSAFVLLGTPAWAVALTDLQFSSLPGGRIEVALTFDGAAPTPETFTIEQPARIALTLPGTMNRLENRYHSLGVGNAREVTVVQAGDRTRVVISLTELVPYKTRVEDQRLIVEVGGAAAEQISSGEENVALTARRTADADGASRVLDVDFRRGEENEGRVLLQLSNPRVPVNVTSEGGRVKVEISDTELPARLRRRLDVADFATPVRTIEATQEGSDTVIRILPSGDYDYLAYQADDQLTVTVKPVTPEERAEQDDTFKYKGEKLSLNFQDIEVRSVLQLIADFTKLNLVAADTVSGRITLRLENVPWDQALDLILKTKGLDKRQIGNVLMVAPAAEIAAREKLELENSRQLAELAPLRTEFLQVRYANATELFNGLLNPSSGGGSGGSAGGGQANRSMLSPRGSAIVDSRTNTIIVTDTADQLAAIRRVFAQLDIPVRQVLIESRIVTASDNYTEQLGIRWGGGLINQKGGRFIKYGGSATTLSELQDIVADPESDGEITSPDDLVVDLGISGDSVTSFGIGVTGDLYLLDLELSALATDGVAEVVARPKVITADKKKATILSGVEIPYQEATSSGATSTQFKEAVLSLEVTPQITPDDRIIMDLKVNQDSVGQVFNGIPSINTNEIETQVLVDNGQTVVLGGIFISDTNNSTTKTPFLGDLPYVGRLFRRTIERQQKQEILIFITPRIMEDVLSAR